MKTKAYTPKCLLPQEMSEVNRLRKEGKSIKAIAKSLHKSDKAVAAYLRPIEAKRKIFDKFTKYTGTKALSACNDFVAVFTKGIFAQQDLFNGKLSKKELQKKLNALLNEMRDAYIDAAMQMVILTLWTMPAKYKQLWLNMAGEDPNLPTNSKAKDKDKAK